MKVLLETRSRWKGIRKSEVARKARAILDLLGSSDAELSILLTGDEEIRQINADYRNIDRPTDVIAFAMREGDFGDLHEEILGDVVISIDTAKRQAEERGHSLWDELLFLLIHGILHLHAYDHEQGGEMMAEMEAKEREIAAKVA
ncbi:MAG: rRNA maturation RNase YbeY [Proteobacteria bacterium]|nr:rRNA maturation RNase YbeY [Pseudomonadota bacterium]